MTELRIAYVINSVEGGGASRPVPDIAHVLKTNGAEVRVFALTGRDRRGLPAMIAAGLDPAVREGGLTDHLAAALWLRRQFLDWRATHIWTSLSRATILGLILGPLMGLPVISWQHAAFLKPWNHRLLRLLQSRAALWVGDSRAVTDLTAQRLGVPPERLACWPIFAADPKAPEAPAWERGQPLSIGSLGRLHPVKGYDVLIAALAILRQNGFVPPVPLKMSIAGDGPERDGLMAQASRADVEMNLIGFVDQPHEYLSSLHLYIQPSRSEGFCIAAHEAMVAALPVVASAVGELPLSIDPGRNGVLVTPDDPVELAMALGSLLSDPDQLKPMGEVARKAMLKRFSAQHFTSTGVAIIDRIRAASV